MIHGIEIGVGLSILIALVFILARRVKLYTYPDGSDQFLDAVSHEGSEYLVLHGLPDSWNPGGNSRQRRSARRRQERASKLGNA